VAEGLKPGTLTAEASGEARAEMSLYMGSSGFNILAKPDLLSI
jgi:hypothetical protein